MLSFNDIKIGDLVCLFIKSGFPKFYQVDRLCKYDNCIESNPACYHIPLDSIDAVYRFVSGSFLIIWQREDFVQSINFPFE